MTLYVYRVTNTITKQYYIGSRTSHRLLDGVRPEKDLWVKYFTSSKFVKQLIDQYGKDSFKTEVVFRSEIDGLVYWQEQLLIAYHMQDPLCLNKTTKMSKTFLQSINHYDTPTAVDWCTVETLKDFSRVKKDAKAKGLTQAEIVRYRNLLMIPTDSKEKLSRQDIVAARAAQRATKPTKRQQRLMDMGLL
jgi:hypothetical protein